MVQTEHLDTKKDFQDFIYDLLEELHDLKNILQLLEIALQENEDDVQITRSIHLLDKMVSKLVAKGNASLGLKND